MRKLISLLLALTMVLGCAAVVFADEPTPILVEPAPEEDTLISPAPEEVIAPAPQPAGPAAIYSGLYIDAEKGIFYLTDLNAKVIKTMEGPTAAAKTFAGKSSVEGLDGIPLPAYNDGAADVATFASPWAITPYLQGLAISDPGNAKLRYVAGGRVQTINISVNLKYPTGLATDKEGNLYVADTGADKVLIVSTKGKVIKTITGLYEPTGLYWADGVLYIAETGKNRIMTYDASGLKVLAGQVIEDGDEFLGGFTNGDVKNAQFARPEGVLATKDGVYVADSGNAAIRLIKDGRVSTFALGTGDANSIQSPRALAAYKETLYVTDSFNGLLLSFPFNAAKTFTDVADSDWFAAAVASAAGNGLISGYPDGSFKPQADVTRAQFATMLANMMLQMDGQMVIGGDKDFVDVADTDWFASYVRWAGDQGFIAGSVKDDKAYAMPNAALSREQLVTILYNVAEGQKLAVTATKDVAVDNYPDASEMASYAAIPMQRALNAGLLSGFADGTLRPAATVTRAQAASILSSFLTSIGF